MHAVDHAPAHFARQVDVAGRDSEAELVNQAAVRGVPLAEHLAADLDGAPVLEAGTLDAAAGTVASLEKRDIDAGLHQVSGRAQPRESAPHTRTSCIPRASPRDA